MSFLRTGLAKVALAATCLLVAAVLLGALVAVPPASAEDRLVVPVEGGSVRGVAEAGALAWRGVPYAAPPLGALRWRAPQPVVPWTGVRDALAYGDSCMQAPFAGDAAPIGSPVSEDCLTLNVWRPENLAGPLPVLVWIHGGGFLNGGSSAAIFDGGALARRGLVVVTLNYRLGRLGFFAHPAVLAEGERPTGNFGHLDQLAALRWVQSHIAGFGGDPAKVTLAGESAGGASVLNLLTAPEAEGLFAAAIVMSGGGRKALVARPMRAVGGAGAAETADAAFAATLDVEGDGPDALAALRAIPAARFVENWSLAELLQGALTSSAPMLDGTPMLDVDLLIGTPQAMFLLAARIPVMIGTTAQDIPLEFPPADDPFFFFGPDREAAEAAFDPGGALPPPVVFFGIGADMTMHEPARFVARMVTTYGRPAWLYRFIYVAESEPKREAGATHSAELPYFFDTLDARYPGRVTEKDRAVASAFADYVANFVKTGDPNGGGLPAWPRFDPAAFDIMQFTLDDGPVFGPDPRAARIGLVERARDRR